MLFLDPDGMWGLPYMEKRDRRTATNSNSAFVWNVAAEIYNGVAGTVNLISAAIDDPNSVPTATEMAMDAAESLQDIDLSDPDTQEKIVAGVVVLAAGELLKLNVKGEVSTPEATTLKGTKNPKVKAALDKGNAAHADFFKRAEEKGWDVEPRLTDPQTGETVIPDAVTTSGHPLELKPNTPSGKAKGKSQLPKYERATNSNGRVIYYNPDEY